MEKKNKQGGKGERRKREIKNKMGEERDETLYLGLLFKNLKIEREKERARIKVEGLPPGLKQLENQVESTMVV